ncbi:MAG: hypothetical protein ACODAD_08445 [Planctomycetota bacterium]
MLFFRSTWALEAEIHFFFKLFPDSELGDFQNQFLAVGTERAWKEASDRGTQTTIWPTGHNPLARGAAP